MNYLEATSSGMGGVASRLTVMLGTISGSAITKAEFSGL
jgi:hypothetical protein